MGYLDVDAVLRFWPVLLIALGLFRIIDSPSEYGHTAGVFWVVIGAFFLLGTLGILRVTVHVIWPVLLIAFGGLLLWRSILANERRRSSRDTGATGEGVGPIGEGAGPISEQEPISRSTSHFKVTAILGASERRINSQDFRGGEITVFMGGCEVDLRRASIVPTHQAVINIFAMFGGVEIRIPDDWTIVSEVEVLLGGFDDKKTDQPKNESKRVIIRGTVVMGGIEIRN
jgi:predicted membrane protein